MAWKLLHWLDALHNPFSQCATYAQQMNCPASVFQGLTCLTYTQPIVHVISVYMSE